VSESYGVPARPPSIPPRWRKGTRAIRLRTARRAGAASGQPRAPVTDPGRVRHRGLAKHTCGECFGPRSAYRDSLFCNRCELALFGDSRAGYQRFLRSERARTREMAKRRPRKAAS
jgi:hypothetical protein